MVCLYVFAWSVCKDCIRKWIYLEWYPSNSILKSDCDDGCLNLNMDCLYQSVTVLPDVIVLCLLNDCLICMPVCLRDDNEQNPCNQCTVSTFQCIRFKRHDVPECTLHLHVCIVRLAKLPHRMLRQPTTWKRWPIKPIHQDIQPVRVLTKRNKKIFFPLPSEFVRYNKSYIPLSYFLSTFLLYPTSSVCVCVYWFY